MEAINRYIGFTDTITVLLVLSFALITLMHFFYPSRFATFLILPINNKYLALFNKKDKLLNWFHIGTSLFQIINFAIFIYIVLVSFQQKSVASFSEIFIVLVFYILLFLLVKLILQLIAGFIFDIQNKVVELAFNKQSYFNYSAFVAFVFNVLLVYIVPNSIVLIYLALGLIILINIAGIFTLLKANQNLFRSHFVYFILYLCALEISPLVILTGYLKG